MGVLSWIWNIGTLVIPYLLKLFFTFLFILVIIGGIVQIREQQRGEVKEKQTTIEDEEEDEMMHLEPTSPSQMGKKLRSRKETGVQLLSTTPSISSIRGEGSGASGKDLLTQIGNNNNKHINNNNNHSLEPIPQQQQIQSKGKRILENISRLQIPPKEETGLTKALSDLQANGDSHERKTRAHSFSTTLDSKTHDEDDGRFRAASDATVKEEPSMSKLSSEGKYV